MLWFGQEEINLPKRFRAIEPCGQGTYGFVFVAECNGERVAIKKMKAVLGKASTARRFLRELVVLRHLSHDNILGIRELLVPPTRKCHDIYVVYEMMDTDLSSVLKSKQRITLSQTQLIFYQIIRGLKYLHSVGVIHRDIKPRNLLINSNCGLKIADMGLVRLETGTPQMTEYVCTRWYRAPEMLYQRPTYDCKVDIFSAGCVLGELVSLKPLMPGSSSSDQLEITLRRLGPVDEEDMQDIPPGAYADFISAINKRVPRGGDMFKYLFGETNRQHILDVGGLLRSMLYFNWRKRSSASEVLSHPFFGDLRMKEDEPVCEAVSALNLDWDDNYNTQQLSQIYLKICEESNRIRSMQVN